MPHAARASRRRCERTIVARTLSFTVDSDRSQIANNAFAVDLSELGARIRSRLKLVPGQFITVIPKEGSKQAVPSRVIWVGKQGSKTAGEAGIAFLQPLTQGMY